VLARSQRLDAVRIGAPRDPPAAEERDVIGGPQSDLERPVEPRARPGEADDERRREDRDCEGRTCARSHGYGAVVENAPLPPMR